MPIQPVYGDPDGLSYQSHPTSHTTDITFTAGAATDAYDDDTITYAEWTCGSGGTYLDVHTFNTTGAPTAFNISTVDFKMHFYMQGGGKCNYQISYEVTPSATVTVLLPWTTVAQDPAATVVWADKAEPNDGTWNWTDVTNVHFIVEVKTVAGGSTRPFREHEAWLNVTASPPAHPTVYIDPDNRTDTTLTPENLIIKPNADGTYTAWTGDFQDWDEYPSHDGDSTCVKATAGGGYESSTLENHSTETWSIAEVKIHVFARTEPTAVPGSPDENLTLGLVIATTPYFGLAAGRVVHTPEETYKEFASEWGLNPATKNRWTWSDIDALEAGVWRNGTAPWTGELRVTQLYVEVSGKRLELDICVDYVTDLWGFQFELTFNPETVILGVHANETTPYPPFKLGAFLTSAGGHALTVPGAGWNNTVGRLGITGANLMETTAGYCPTGGGVLATITFDVVGEGESEIRLGEATGLKTYTGQWIVKGRSHVRDGYFRNILKSLIPNARFTVSPVNTPAADGPLEGYNTTFDATSSTAAGSRTIQTYEWRFWETVQSTGFKFPAGVLRPDGDGTYTDWMNNTAAPANYTLWDDVTSDGDYTYVKATAGGMYETSTLQNHTTEAWPIKKIRVTFFARANESTDELVYPMLVIGGKRYNGTRYAPGLTYAEYTQEWSANPKYGTAWNWSSIDNLEAGVVSEQVGGTWTGEIRVTQIYVEVIPDAFVTSTPTKSWDTVTWNYTSRGKWNVTITVIDNLGAISTNTSYVEIKAHDVYIIDIRTNTTETEYPIGTNCTDIDSVMEINVTAKDQGHFAETFDVTCFWHAYYAAADHYGTIGTQTNINLAAGANTTLTFNWDTTGRNLTHPTYYTIHANASRVLYEYDIEWKEGKIAPNEYICGAPHRIRFHDIAVTDVDLFNHLVLKPDGDSSTYTGWTGDYTDWDEYPTHDGDTTCVNATAANLDESSTLENHATEAWTIQKVRVTVVARANKSTNDRIYIMLVIGTTKYYSSTTRFTPTTTYSEYTAEWTKNPATTSNWAWSDIDSLEAGVRSYAQFGWDSNLKMMVTQLYVEVFGSGPSGSIQQGEMVRITVTVDNEGDYNESSIIVKAYFDDTLITPIGTHTISWMTNSSYAERELPGNNTATLTFIWDTSGVSSGTYTIKANATKVPGDYNNNTNTFIDGTVTVVGAVPEFPLGAALEIALVAVVIYIWWKYRRRTKRNRLVSVPNR